MATRVVVVVVVMVAAAATLVVTQKRTFRNPLVPWGAVSTHRLRHDDLHFIHREGPGTFFGLITLPPHNGHGHAPHAPGHPGPVSLSVPAGAHVSRPQPRPPLPHPSLPPLPPLPFKTRGGGFVTSFYEHTDEGPGGCQTKEGFYFAGQTWFTKGCRRRKCIHFRSKFFTETDSCDSEIFNTTYKCVIKVDTTADFPRCCPTYKCNPDNLGNNV